MTNRHETMRYLETIALALTIISLENN